MNVLVRPHRVERGTNDVSLNVCPKMRKKVVSSPPSFWTGMGEFNSDDHYVIIRPNQFVGDTELRGTANVLIMKSRTF